MKRSGKTAIAAIGAALILFAVDFATKYYTSTSLPLLGSTSPYYPYGGIALFHDFLGIDFSIVHATNRGAAWGILSSYQELLLAGRIVTIVVLTTYALFFNKNSRLDLPLALIISGATANICDYFIYGHVIDMFNFTFWGYHYPVFNVADSAICLGVALLFFCSRREVKAVDNEL